ncbi:MBL fold metallo-hydrolase [Halobaculum sp. CBA1158]|uniref:MBL fold metallo-hydrolase n=1 Tax=Halobaculum sp. CBA1158 TaxID=2904243 RepID=UPI001F3B6A4B|nr:MBL fold metallo-hydrolase [Halobaculum sp. CBA1158]UIP01306.1 MBL fold metallo-hydrolase [Halobaculum sp. CBA1158]
MEPGDVEPIPGCTDLYYLDTGMYDTANYGAVYLVDAERPAVIDTGIGTNREYLFDALDSLGITPEFVLPTHVHLDHAGGTGFLAERYPDATVMIHETGVDHLVDPERLVAGTKSAVGDQWRHYVEPEPVPADRIESLSGGETLDLGDRDLDVHHAPGHAPHQVIFHDRGDDVLFAADAAGIYIPELDRIEQTSPPSRFDLHGCQDDADTIRDLDPRYVCFGHFGPREFEDRLLAEYKRTLAEWVEAVRQKREELGDDEAVIEHFAANAPEDHIEVWGEEKAREEERLNTRGVLGYLDYKEKRGETV